MRMLFLALSMCLVAGVASASSELGWDDLIDQAAQTFDDPYRDLSYTHLEAVAAVARLRGRLASDDLVGEERAQVESRLGDAEALLSAAGIDADWLIAQRWVVAERRERAATAGNPVVDGKKATLSGYAIPAPRDEDGTPTAYLVPERGMCAHMPPPPPNQMIRMRMPEEWVPRMMHEPMQVTGLLEIDPSKHQVMVVDGFVPMHATFALRVQELRILGGSQTSDGKDIAATNDWAAGIAERLRAARGVETNGN